MKLNDSMKFFQEEDSDLEFVETDSKKLFIIPAVKLKAGRFYIVDVTETYLRVFESIADINYQQDEGTLQ